MFRYITILLLFIKFTMYAQLPETDLWLFKLKSEKGISKITEGKNITSRKGYDNQPVFSPDDKAILYVSIREDNQSDVYRYDLKKEISVQLTKTRESEYSPHYVPSNDAISCVVVEGDSTQRLWLYNLDGTLKKCYNEKIDSIGYYSWLSKDTLLYYKLTSPHSLKMFQQGNNEDKWICFHPARAFRKSGGNTFIYAIKDSSQIQYRMYNTVLKKSDLYAVHKSVAEDFVWDETLGLLKSEGNSILRYDTSKKSWEVLYDLSSYGIKKITRFSLDKRNRYLVVVDNT